MDMKLISCPICLKPHFKSADALRSSLINAATTHISCPVCNDLLLGLDKLTIHLFTHISTNFAKNFQNMAVDFEESVQIQDETVNINEKVDINLPFESDVHLDIVQSIEDNNTKEQQAVQEAATAEVDINVHETEIQPVPSYEQQNHVYCDICDFHFSDNTILDLHQKLLHKTAPDKKTGKYSYHCHLCSKKFKLRGSLMVHLRVAHLSFIQVQRSNIRENSYNSVNTNINVNNVSEKKLDKLEQNVVHENADKFHSDNSMQEEQNSMLVTCNKVCDNKQWECDVCLKLFTTKYFLKKHKRLHTGEMPYYCQQCNKYFTFQQSYHKHMLYHSDDKPHICTECGRAFKELSTLHNHMRIHSGERPFACETCGKCFRQRVSYLVHRRIHTGSMPYKCTACDKSFRYKVSQRSHKCVVNPPGVVVKQPDLEERHGYPMVIETNNIDHTESNNTCSYFDSVSQNSNISRPGSGVLRDDTSTEQSVNKLKSILNNISEIELLPQNYSVMEGNILENNFTMDNQNMNNSNQNVFINHKNIYAVDQVASIKNLNSSSVQNFDCFEKNQRNIYKSVPQFNIVIQNIQQSSEVFNKSSCSSVTSNNTSVNDKLPPTISHISLSRDVKIDSHTSAVITDIKNKVAVPYRSEETNSDFFSLILSPVLSDVQSLCLSGQRKSNGKDSATVLQTINQESLKELLYGSTK